MTFSLSLFGTTFATFVAGLTERETIYERNPCMGGVYIYIYIQWEKWQNILNDM